jgi:hypothetical protein
MPLTFLLAAALAAPLAPEGASKPATNKVCPVMGDRVDAKSPETVVNGRAYKLCCKGCDKKLQAAPTRYLLPDGTPRNAARAESK